MGACCGNSSGADKKDNLNINDIDLKPMNRVQKRWDLLAMPHKGFKKMWGDLLIESGSCDYSSEAEFSNFQKHLISTCKCYTIHNYTENEIFQDLKEKEPEVYKEWTQDHDSHVKELEDFVKLAEIITKQPMDKRQEKGEILFQKLGLFISKDLIHMNWEQDVGMKALWKHYSDQELLEITQAALKRYDTPESLQFLTPFIVQAGGLEENIEYIQIVKGLKMKKEEIEVILQQITSLMSPIRVQKLKQMKIL